MSKVVVVTDSTSNIPTELTKNQPLTVVPLQVIWGEKTYRDGVDITPEEFYTRLSTSKVSPTTSQPSPADYIRVYERLLAEGSEILSIHVSAKLSGTLDSATQAKANFPGAKIELVDSTTTSMALGFNALMALRAAVEGASLEECRQVALNAREHTGLVFAVNTLEYLRRGGRIGGAAAFLGTALNLKPLLELRDGRIEAVERVRTMNKAIDRLLDLFEERINHRTPLRIACIHAQAYDEACTLLERVRVRFGNDQVVEAHISEVSPVIGTHTGPGCMGLAYMAGL